MVLTFFLCASLVLVPRPTVTTVVYVDVHYRGSSFRLLRPIGRRTVGFERMQSSLTSRSLIIHGGSRTPHTQCIGNQYFHRAHSRLERHMKGRWNRSCQKREVRKCSAVSHNVKGRQMARTCAVIMAYTSTFHHSVFRSVCTTEDTE